jgi:hypothetical protein
MATSPEVLAAYVGFSGALVAGHLDPKIREQIALVTAESLRLLPLRAYGNRKDGRS